MWNLPDAMKVVDKRVKNLLVDHDTRLLGIAEGETIVQEGANFEVHGTVIGKLILNSGSITILKGTLNGIILAKSGSQLQVYGVINGTIDNASGSKVSLDKKAIVNPA